MIITNLPEKGQFTIGGKAIGLFRLRAAGIAVPDFLVITAETFASALKYTPPEKVDLDGCRQKLAQFILTKADQTEIERVLASWNFPADPVVVRSSIADEDGEQDAFPGMMDSYLNLLALSDVLAAVAACAASAYSERAIVYRQQKKLTLNARPAIIIQRQITPQASGVLFTTFPEYPQELALHAVWGFGEGLVNGALAPDEFYFLKNSGQLHRQKIVAKELQIGLNPPRGTQEMPVPTTRQNIPCLTTTHLNQLFTLGTRLEKEFGHPQDMEFVVKGDQVWIVQARPITQPIPEIIVYDNSNIQESYCGVTTPLTFSFAQRAYATVYRQTMQTLGLPKATIQANEEVVTQLLGLVKGRIYYNINRWYQGLQLLPAFKQNKADMERMMGLEDPVDFVQSREKTILQKLQLVPALTGNLFRLLWAFTRLPRRVTAFHRHFNVHYARFYRQALSELTLSELLRQREILDNELLQNWTTPIVNDFYVMMTNGQVQRLLKKARVAEPEEFLSRYLAGDQQLASTQPTQALQELATRAFTVPGLPSLIEALPANLPDQVQQLYPEFAAAVGKFINQYGDRTAGELKLETATMRVEPLIFYRYLRNFLVAGPDSPTPVPALHPAAVQELQTLIQPRLFWFRRRVWRSLSNLQRGIRYREALRLERTRLFGMYRALYRALGQKLTQSAQLQYPEDIFYLTETEITAAGAAPNNPETQHLVQDRKAEFALYRKEEVPNRIMVPAPPAPEIGTDYSDLNELRGTGCYPGIVTGEALVITEPGGELAVAGKIVAALRTDPGWAALFPSCKGVLIEKGSALSHSVILLRELGIPTIINIPHLVKRVKSGQLLTINGSTGEIYPEPPQA